DPQETGAGPPARLDGAIELGREGEAVAAGIDRGAHRRDLHVEGGSSAHEVVDQLVGHLYLGDLDGVEIELAHLAQHLVYHLLVDLVLEHHELESEDGHGRLLRRVRMGERCGAGEPAPTRSVPAAEGRPLRSGWGTSPPPGCVR